MLINGRVDKRQETLRKGDKIREIKLRIEEKRHCETYNEEQESGNT